MSTSKVEIQLVRINETVLQKIIKHGQTYEKDQDNKKDEDYVGGKLLGYYNDSNQTIEIGTSYATPNTKNLDEANYTYEEYVQQMTKRLDQINIDNFDCGWYQVNYKANHLINFSVFEMQKEMQAVNPYSIYFVYDILEARNGSPIPFKAYRLNDQFIELSKKQMVNQEELKKYSSQLDQIFIPIKVEIIRSPLTQVFLNMYGNQLKEKYVNKKSVNPMFDYGNEFVRNAEILAEAINDVQNQNGLNMEETQIQNKLVEEGKQDKIQVKTKKFIDSRFIQERVEDITQLISHQAQINQQAQDVLESLKQE